MVFNPTTENLFSRLIRLLDIEAEAEKQEMLRDMQRTSAAGAEALGNCLTRLVIREQDAGLGGRILLTFGKRNQNLGLPWTRLNVGSPVILSEEGRKVSDDQPISGWRGTISRLNKDSIQVAFSNWPETEEDNPTFRLDKSSDEISRKRQIFALEQAQKARESRLGIMRDVLLGKQPALTAPNGHFLPFNRSLNDSQFEAVGFALGTEDVAIIHGPPGTGKTTVLIELMRQIVAQGQSVLAVAPSNLAVDNLLEKLSNEGEKALRLGHPARVTPALRQLTLDEMVESHSDMHLVKKLQHDAYHLQEQASKYTRARPEPGSRQAYREEAKRMLDEAQLIEDQLVDRLISSSQIVCCTTTGLDHQMIKGRRFDWCIIDEASQSTEPGCWIPILYADRLVLAGDHFQLPPTIISAQACAEGLNISLLERLVKQHGTDITRRLNTQYRMHQQIMAFSSTEFYENDLEADSSVSQYLLQDIPGVESSDFTGTAVDFIDTAGASYDENHETDGDSHYNPQEADLVMKKVNALLESGLPAQDVAVISPYSAQVKLLRTLIKHPEVEIDSVDGFQGREKEAIVVSLVRSNPDGQIGFLEDIRRMNVALTRAKRKLIVIGDSATITSHPFYKRMVNYFDSIGAYHSVWEEY